MVLPQGHIRLIKILPRGDDDVVRCSTLVRPLRPRPNPPDFVALSYTWGNPPTSPDGHAIELDGIRILIRKNLWRFLVQISQPCSGWTELMWIDSISIDQTDADEKSQQIGMMGTIFHRANKVIVWLGPAYNESDEAMKALTNHAESNLKQHNRTRFWSERAGVALVRLCNRPYWTRLWVFQELLLAADIVLMCGSQSIPWAIFQAIVSSLDLGDGHKHSSFQDTQSLTHGKRKAVEQERLARKDRRNGDIQAALRSPALAMVQQKRTRKVKADGLYSLMTATRGLDCVDPKDRIFALLGVASAKSTFDITADYKQSVRILLNNVLRSYHAERPPSGIEEVATQCNELASMFNTSPNTIFELGNGEHTVPLPRIRNVEGCPLGDPHRSAITLWWTTCYGHSSVRRLLLRTSIHSSALLRDTWMWAVEHGETSALGTLLLSGMALPEWCSEAVSLAAEAGDKMLMQLLFRYGRRHIPVPDITNAFIKACNLGHEELIALLLANGADIDSRNEDGETVLYTACGRLRYACFEGVVRTLVLLGADVNPQFEYSSGRLSASPLQLVCGHNTNHAKERFGRYLSSGQYAETTDVDGSRERLVHLLVEHGAKVNAQGGYFGNALQAACACRNLAVVKFLLENGADVGPVMDGGYYGTALIAASKRTNDSFVRLMLAHGADANAPGKTYLGTAIQVASFDGNVNVVWELLEHGADINAQSGVHGNALQVACAEGHVELVQFLLENGAEIYAKGPSYESAFRAGSNHEDVL